MESILYLHKLTLSGINSFI